MAKPHPIITLLTDFGERDGYVGAMRGVMLSITPEARLVDISHEVAPQDIRQAALILSSVYTYFPSHTVHLVVVDPGVGGKRHPIAVETPRGRFVAPDNGVLTYVWLAEPESRAVTLDKPEYWLPSPSYTFHGRDIFSPVAAHLAGGATLDDVGSPLEDPVMLSFPPLSITPEVIRGEVIQIDRFGNVLTNIMHLKWLDEEWLELQPIMASTDLEQPVRINARRARVTSGWHNFQGIHQTYSQVEVGQTIALVGSNGELELAINQGNANKVLGIDVGDTVTIHL
ncbi:MAG TPA: hypothetical protein ENI95_15085 [Chloroflexi bacterium]|nr:hypothetical protein [Chloroflexota bacterium]